MKHFFSYIFICLFITPYLIACPTCVGTLKKESPVFFSDELYTIKKSEHVKKTKDKKPSLNHTQ